MLRREYGSVRIPPINGPVVVAGRMVSLFLCGSMSLGTRSLIVVTTRMGPTKAIPAVQTRSLLHGTSNSTLFIVE
jgi:hypothetical protein